jgi:sortase A
VEEKMKKQKQWKILGVVFLLITGILLCGSSVWIYAKACLAQVLLRQAWEQTLVQGSVVKAWPWADTWPVARLSVPQYGQDLIVLAGQAGATLAFGPGMLAGGAQPGNPGICILAGHRDTSFRFLKQIQVGDMLVLQAGTGEQLHYRVASTAVRRAEDLYLEQLPISRLALVTCFPFDAVLPGTPERYVVLAELVELLLKRLKREKRSV